MDIMHNQKPLQKVMKKYENLSYLDQYSSSVLLLFVAIVIIFLILSYSFVKTNSTTIKENWATERCKPYIMPFAGMINKPNNMSAGEYTRQNFEYCIQNIIKGVTGDAVQPLTFVVHMLNSMANMIKDGINSAREMIDDLRNKIEAIVKEIMGRIANMMIPLQQMIIGIRDMIAKVQGVVTAGLYTLLGSYMTLQSLMGSIGQIIVTILILLALAAAVLWIVPFTWGAAAVMTAIFIALAVPFALILVFLKDTMNIGSGLTIPSVKCFDENTLIMMEDGREKQIKNIEIGDRLIGDVVTSKIKVTTENSRMYNLHGIIVSDSHVVYYKNKNEWIRVCEHPEATQIKYDKPYLYCLNTHSKEIRIREDVFTDWDELYGIFLIKIQKMLFSENQSQDIHKYFNTGFSKETPILLQNGVLRSIEEIQVGDILEKGEKVYGIVKIDGSNLNKQFVFHLGKNVVCGSQHLYEYNKYTKQGEPFLKYAKCVRIIPNKDILFHLLTDKGTFRIHDIDFCDYNACIDTLLEKAEKEREIYI